MLGNEFDLLINILIAVLGVALGGIAFLIISSSKGNGSRLESNSQKDTTKKDERMNLNKEDIIKFMEFDKIEDDMIIQENRKQIYNGFKMSRYKL